MINGTHPAPPMARKELFAAIADRLGDNQRLLETTGKPSLQQLKVFWLEVNQEYTPKPLIGSPWRATDSRFYTRLDPAPPSQNHMWLDASNDRIWYVYTFADRKFASGVIQSELTSQKGVDRVWLAEDFLESVRGRKGYQGRGFGFSFKGILARETAEEELPRFSAKFWLGNTEATPEQRAFLSLAKDTFSTSSVRMGRGSLNPEFGGSGVLLEIFSRGHMTVTTSEDPEEVLGLINEIGSSYATELRQIESRRLRFPRPVEFGFHTDLDLERFRAIVESGVGPTRLWLQRYEVEGELHRYTGVDLHTNQLLNLDVAPSFAYLVIRKTGCMNAAPRLMTISTELLSSKTSMSFEGAQMFA